MTNRVLLLIAKVSFLLLTMGTSCITNGPYFAVKQDVVCPVHGKQPPISGGDESLQFELETLYPPHCAPASVYIATKPRLSTRFYSFVARDKDKCQLIVAFGTVEKGMQSLPRLSDSDEDGAFLKSKKVALQISNLMGLKLIGEATFAHGKSNDETIFQFCRGQSH